MKVFVDTAAVMEKPLAQAAGLGWQGKHTNLVSREFGSWLFLGAIFTTLDLPRDEADERPLRLVPGLPRHLPDRGVSRALQARCAALHFVSHHRAQGPDPARISQSHRQPHLWLRRLSGGVPVEQVRARRARERSSARATSCARRRLRSWRGSTTRRFRALFAKSPVKRIGRDRFVRNVLIAIGNSGDASLADEAERLLDDDSRAGARRCGVGAVATDAAGGVRRARANAISAERTIACARNGVRRMGRASRTRHNIDAGHDMSLRST